LPNARFGRPIVELALIGRFTRPSPQDKTANGIFDYEGVTDVDWGKPKDFYDFDCELAVFPDVGRRL